MKRLAIYCVTYHSYNELYRFLQSVEEAALRVSSSLTVDVYVADNTDSQIQPVSDSCSACHLKVFQLKHNWGYFGAIQKMLKQTDVTPYDFVVISNVDLIVSVDAFEKLLSVKSDENVGWLAPKIYSEIEERDKNPKIIKRYSLDRLRILRLMYTFPVLHKLYTRTFYKRKKVQQKETVYDGRKIYAGHGSFIILTCSYISRCGLPDYPVFLFGEEIYLAEKCRQHGLKVIYEPTIEIRDIEHISTGCLARRMYYRYNKEAIEYIIHTFYSKM